MSQQLYIIYGGSTLDFQAGGYKVCDGFYPETPAEGAESVTERFDIFIIGSSDSDLRSKRNAIASALVYAKAHKDDVLAAYLYYDVSNTGDASMSKLLGGDVFENAQLDHRWRESKARVSIILEHKPYWDSKTEIQVPLSNGNGTNNTAGLNIFNHGDGGGSSPNKHDNYVAIAAADVIGDLPGPTRLEVLNTYATSRLYNLWIGHNWTDPDNFIHILEGESSSTGTEKDAANTCSADHYMQYALASGAEDSMFTWALADSFLDACKGQFYKFMARFQAAAPTSVKLRLKILYQGTVVWQSGQVIMDSSRAYQVRDLFTLRVPPWLVGQTGLSALSMILTGQQGTGVSLNVDLDFLQIMPLDGWRMLECAGYGVVQNNRMIDDGFNGTKYIDDGAGDNRTGILIGYGHQIELYPGKKQRLYFLMHSWVADVAEIDRTISLKLFYRPRRKTL